jgi:hypothetical protein
MIVTACQRWRDRRGTYRPAGEPLNPRAHEVFELHDDATAKAFVVANHYSATYPAARRRFGLHRAFVGLVGVAVFSQPMQNASLRPWSPADAMELGRLVLLDLVEANAESWFLARCFEALRVDGLAGIVSHSDPEPRADAAGRVVFVGHVGTVYQSLGAVYTGRASPRTMRVTATGRELSNRAASKLRQGERGWRYAVEQLVAAGATAPVPGADLAAWYRAEVARVTRAQRHHGNHRYVWALSRGAHRDLLGASLPYPKLDLRGAA